MGKTKTRTLDEVYEAGLDALARELGPADMVRFLQQFVAGSGDYVAERYELLGSTDVRTVAAEIRARRAAARDMP